jgi:hypothetical protein
MVATYGWLGAGCATTSSSSPDTANLGYQPLNRAALRISAPHTLVVPVLPAPEFGVDEKPNYGAGAVVGVIGELRSCATEPDRAAMHLEDPATSIRTAIASRLAKRFSLQIPEAAIANPDLMLEVSTTNWTVVPAGVGQSAFKYEGKIRLVDQRRKLVLADGICKTEPISGEGVRSCAELVRNGGERLKQELSAAAEFCIEDYRTRLLGLY